MLTAHNKLSVEGVVQANGRGGASTIGGGSGGSVDIHTNHLHGSGSIQVRFC